MALPPKVAPKKTPVDQKKTKSPTLSGLKILKKKRSFFSPEKITIDYVANEELEVDRQHRLQTMVLWQSVIIAILAGGLILLAPLSKPIYRYYARDPAGNSVTLSPLIMPNMTNRAVLSWAVTSVTEVMTFGFGDIITQLASQKPRFTPTGWDSFVAAFHRQDILSTFKSNQLVLTTAPSDTAVILAQGKNENGVYQWRVQVPVVMTYATNNNFTRHLPGIITLLIVRVPPDQNPAGIAIRNWSTDR